MQYKVLLFNNNLTKGKKINLFNIFVYLQEIIK